MNRKNKRLQFVSRFFEECAPQTEQDLCVIYNNVDMMRYLKRTFQSTTSRALQVTLCKQFDLINRVFGATTHASQPSSQPIVYVGLYDCLLNHKKDLEAQIAGLQDALCYAELRQSNPKQNMIHIYSATA